MTDCDFCATCVDHDDEPANLGLLRHLDAREECREQFEHLLANIRTSWTPSMSGG